MQIMLSSCESAGVKERNMKGIRGNSYGADGGNGNRKKKAAAVQSDVAAIKIIKEKLGEYPAKSSGTAYFMVRPSSRFSTVLAVTSL